MRGLSLLVGPLLLIASQAALAEAAGTCESQFEVSSVAQTALSIKQRIQVANELLGPLPKGADTTFGKKALLKPAAAEMSPEEAWKKMASIIVDWAKSRKDFSFAGVDANQILFKGGEFTETTLASKIKGKIKSRVIVGNGSPARPQHWVFEFSHADLRHQDMVWLTRVVISTEPGSDHLLLVTDNAHFYTGASAGRKVWKTTAFLKFILPIEKEFVPVSGKATGESSVKNAAAASASQNDGAGTGSHNVLTLGSHQPNAEISLIARLRNDFQGTIAAHGASLPDDDGGHPVFQKLLALGPVLTSNGYSIQDLQITKSQKAMLLALNSEWLKKLSVSKILETYRSLEKIGFQIPNFWKEAFAARLRSEPLATFESLTPNEINAILVFFNPVQQEDGTYVRLLHQSVLSKLETVIFRKVEARPRGTDPSDLPVYFHSLALVSFNLSDVYINVPKSILISSLASEFVGHIEVKHLKNLLKTLTSYRAGLTLEVQRALAQRVTEWLKDPSTARRIDINMLPRLADLLEQPSPELMTELSRFLLDVLNQRTVPAALTGSSLYAMWLLNPEHALKFARNLSASVTAQLPSDRENMKRFKKVAHYYEIMSNERIDWLDAYLAKKAAATGKATSKLQIATNLMALLTRIVPDRASHLLKNHVVRGADIEIDVLHSKERLAIQFERPFDYFTDRTAWKRSLALSRRDDEILRKLDIVVFRLRDTDFDSLTRIPESRYQQVATQEKSLVRILRDLLGR